MEKFWRFLPLLLILFGVSANGTISNLNITSTSMYWGEKIRICTNYSSEMEQLDFITRINKTVLENVTNPLLDTTGNETCIISTEQYHLDGVYQIQIFISIYTINETLVAEGAKNWTYIFPSKNPRLGVFAVDNAIYIIQETVSSPLVKSMAFNYYIYSGNKLNQTHNFMHEYLPFKIETKITGKHSICSQPYIVNEFIPSSTYCSDIIKATKKKPVPDKQKLYMDGYATSSSSLFVKWQFPRTVNLTDGMECLVFYQSCPPNYCPPLTNDVDFENGHSVLVNRHISSFDVEHLDEDLIQKVCVSLLENSVVLYSVCTYVDPSKFMEIEAPFKVQYNLKSPIINHNLSTIGSTQPRNGTLKWESECGLFNFWIEWHRELDGAYGHALTDMSGMDLALPPGNWNISVRALEDYSSSRPTITNTSVKGLIICYRQVDDKSISLSWNEVPMPKGSIHYNITVEHKSNIIATSEPINCSGNETECVTQFSNLKVSAPADLKVNIQNSDESYIETGVIHLDLIEDVKNFHQDESDNFTVVWDQSQNAKFYLLSVYPSKNRTLLRHRNIVSITRYTIPLKSLNGSLVDIQPCVKLNKCGDISSLTMELILPPAPPDDSLIDPKTAVIITVVGLLLIGIMKLADKKRIQLMENRDFDPEYEPIIVTNEAWRRNSYHSTGTTHS